MKKYLTVASIVGLPIGTYFYHGFHRDYPIIEKQIPRQAFVYTQHYDAPSKLNNTIAIINQDFKILKSKLVNPRLAVIYYDDPVTTKETKKQRIVAGIFCDISNSDLAEEFVKIRPNFQLRIIPDHKVVETTLPFKSSSISTFWIHRIIHPKIWSYFVNHGYDKEISSPYILNVINDEDQTCEVRVPYGKNSDALLVSKARRS